MGRQTRAAAPEKTARVLRPRSFTERRRLYARPSGDFSPGFPPQGTDRISASHAGGLRGFVETAGSLGLTNLHVSAPTGARVRGMTGDARRHRAGTRTAPCGHVGGGAAGCNPESSFTSVLPRCASARATLMSLRVKAPQEPPVAGPHVRWGGRSACWLRRRDRMTRRSGRVSSRLRKGRGDETGNRQLVRATPHGSSWRAWIAPVERDPTFDNLVTEVEGPSRPRAAALRGSR